MSNLLSALTWAGPGEDVPTFPSLSLSGWWPASFSGPPWKGGTSAGSSGTQIMRAGDVHSPTVGTGVNGHTPAVFDGIDQNLVTVSNDMTEFIGDAAYSGWALVNVDSISTDDSDSIANTAIIATRGSRIWSLFLRSSGLVGIAHFTNSGDQSASIAFATGAWTLVQFKYDGTNVKMRLNDDSWSSAAIGHIASSPIKLRMGAAVAAEGFLEGKVLDVGFSLAVLSDGQFDEVLDYARDRYSLALT